MVDEDGKLPCVVQDNMVDVSLSQAIKPSESSFTKEILMMMHGFGDVDSPILQTAEMINEFVYEQICCYLNLASDVAQQRDSNEIGIEDIMFLFRSNVPRLFHFMRHLNFRDSKGSLKSSTAKNEFMFESLDFKRYKRTKVSHDFLKCIDSYDNLVTSFQNGDFDNIRLQRLQISELVTRNMSIDQYKYYSTCRQISFGKNMKMFQSWFSLKLKDLKVEPNKYGWESLAYLAYETVAELVYLAILSQVDQHTECKFSNLSRIDLESYFTNEKCIKQPITTINIFEVFRRCYNCMIPENYFSLKSNMQESHQVSQPFLVIV